jgi:hypothetical protein
MSEADKIQTVRRLREELQILASEIIGDPVVLLRHKELAETLIEYQYLDRAGIENILVPTTLPDYSGRIREIGKKFNIPVPQETNGTL